jgi:hypothetical protein
VNGSGHVIGDEQDGSGSRHETSSELAL